MTGIFILPPGIPSQIECNDDSGFGAFAPCRMCGATLFNVEPGSGPHYLGLRCAACEKGHSWICQEQAEIIKTPAAYFENVNEVARYD